MILNDINDIFYDIWYKLGWPDLSLWKRYDTGIKGVITFIVKVITFIVKVITFYR